MSISEKQIQALHAGISRRNWHDTEVAANAIRDTFHRDEIEAAVKVRAIREREEKK